MKKIIQGLFPLLSLGILPLCSLLYDWVNQPGESVFSLETSVDKMIPFSAIFIIPYLLWTIYIYGTLIYFYVKDRKTYFKTLIIYVTGMLICYGIYSVFQTTVSRPIILDTTFPNNIVQWMYSMDAPYNCFPSIHCLSSYLMIRIIRRAPFANPWNKRIITTVSSIIILSTLMVKQHVILDAIAAFLLVEVLCYIAERNWSPSTKTKPLSSSKQVSQ